MNSMNEFYIHLHFLLKFLVLLFFIYVYILKKVLKR